MGKNSLPNSPPKPQQPDTYRAIRGATVNAKYKGFHVAPEVAADTTPLETDSGIFSVRVRRHTPAPVLTQQWAAARQFALGRYQKASRICAVLTLLCMGILFVQESSKPVSHVFVTAGNGKTVRVEAYDSVKDALNAPIPKEQKQIK